MLYEILSVWGIFLSSIGWGAWLKYFLHLKNNSLAITSLLGFALLFVLSFLLSLVSPLDGKIEIVCIALSSIPYFLKQFHLYKLLASNHVFKSCWFWLFTAFILLVGSYYPFNSDHFGYYIPTINWLNQYGTVCGLANINWALGQLSSFHFIQACFDSTLDIYIRLNVCISVIFLIYIFERKAFLLLLFIPFYFLYVQSATPDIIVFFLCLLITNELYKNSEKTNFQTLLILSTFAFIVKPVAFWIPLWLFIVGLSKHGRKILHYNYYLFPILLVVLYLIKNFIVSSTLLFPVTFTKIPTYWLTDSKILEISKQEAAYYTFDHYFSAEKAYNFSIYEKIYYWFSLRELQTVVNIFISVVTIVFGFFSIYKKKFIFLSLWSLILLKFIITFLFSGQYRFFLDGIYPMLFILISQIRFARLPTLILITSLYFLALLCISYPSILKKTLPQFKLSNYIHGFSKKALIRPENYVIKKYSKEKLGTLNFNVTQSYGYTFDIPAPAFTLYMLKTYCDLSIFPQLKDSSNIKKGIYMKKLTDVEKEKLLLILKKLEIKK